MKNSRELEFMFMNHYAPTDVNLALNFEGGGGGGVRAGVNGEVKFL